MTNYNVIKKLLGSIDPVGETNTDNERYENLETTIDLLNQLISDVIKVSHNKTRQEHSMREVGKKAESFLIELIDGLAYTFPDNTTIKSYFETKVRKRIEADSENKPTSEERFLELVNGLVRKFDFEKYPNTVCFWFKDHEVIIEERKNGYVWISYNKIWSVFEREYGYNYNDIKELIKYWLEKHFNLRVTTTMVDAKYSSISWRNISI